MVIDVHTHPFFIKELYNSDEEILFRREKFGLYKVAIQKLELFKKQIKAAGIDKIVLLPLDLTTVHGAKVMSNEDIKKLVDLDPETFIGFGSIDPHSKNALLDLENAVNTLKLKGIKLNPSSQHFYPNDKDLMYPIYKRAQELNIPIMFHSGMTWEPGGLSKFSHPMLLEEVAFDFPKLKLALCHFAWPWIMEAAMLALKYENVYVDTALLNFDSPKEFFNFVFNKQIKYTWIDRSIASKILFGSNYPRIEQKRMKDALESIGLRDVTLKKIFEENPIKFLGLEE